MDIYEDKYFEVDDISLFEEDDWLEDFDELEQEEEEEVVILSPITVYIKEAQKNPRLTKEEEIALGKEKDAGDKEAREKLIKSNLSLVIDLAKKKYEQIKDIPSICLTLDDLIQEGGLGLIKAVDKYNWQRGCRFSTIAVPTIKDAIQEPIKERSALVRIPEQKLDEILFVKRAIRELSSALYRKPTELEIQEYLKPRFSESQLKEIFVLMKHLDVKSLNQPLGEDEEDGELGDMIASRVPSPQRVAEKKAIHRQVMAGLSKLSDAKKWTLIYRFGLCRDGEPKTLEQTAQLLADKGICNGRGEPFTREYIRQLESVALKELRPYLKKAYID